MSQDIALKNLFAKAITLQEKQPTDHDIRLQETDGGFFEKFGLLLRQKSEIGATLSDIAENNGGQGSDDKLISFYSETVKIVTKSSGINVEHLFEEILFVILNCVGLKVDCKMETLVDFIQDVFKLSPEKQAEIKKQVLRKKPPSMRLNVEILKAENLLPKDANGLSDPFVTLFLQSHREHRYNTSVQQATLSPKWEEYFSLPLASFPSGDSLKIEVWDFDAAETVKEKVNKLFNVKGLRGLRKLMKEIAVTASTGKHDNELIGSTEIRLEDIPLTGTTLWRNLQKDLKGNSRGSILVNISASAEKHKSVALHEHCELVRLLLLHELESNEIDPYLWTGKFSYKAEVVRSQHAIHSGLSSYECALCNWKTFACVHDYYPLSLKVFKNILKQIAPVIKCLHMSCEDVLVFWSGARTVLPSCVSVMRNFRDRTAGDKHLTEALRDVLDFLSIIGTIKTPTKFDLFPNDLYSWRKNGDPCDLNRIIVEAIGSGSQEWLNKINNIRPPINYKPESLDESSIQFLIKLIQTVRSDLQRAMEYFDMYFYHKIGVSLSSVLLKFYDPQLSEIIQTSLEVICGHMERIHIPEENFDLTFNVEVFDMKTTLFELYLILKQFLELGEIICPNERLSIMSFYVWFTPAVTHWLDISVFKALKRIEKAIQIDELTLFDENVKYSSSAIDTLAILYQVRIFWQQLDWPEIETCFSFLAKIIDDICRCCVFYAQKMSRRLKNQTSCVDDILNLPLEWCISINNIDYIRQSLPSFTKELGVDEIVKKIEQCRSKLEYDRCAQTLATVIENALDTLQNQILEFVEIFARKMAAPINTLFGKGTEVLHQDSKAIENLVLYFENSLQTLYNMLNQSNFERITDCICSEIAVIFSDLILYNIKKRRPPAIFRSLRETIRTIICCFKIGSFENSYVEVLGEAARTLDLHSSETSHLIHQYYTNQLQKHLNVTNLDHGQLTIKAELTSSSLSLTILNARNLVPLEKNGSCNSYVKVCFLPEDLFLGASPIKTSSQHKTCFPLYEESFIVNLSAEQLSCHDSIVLFSVKETEMFGMATRYIGECCITFQTILDNANEQLHLSLTKYDFQESDILKTLENRQGDKMAKEFLKTLKSRATKET